MDQVNYYGLSMECFMSKTKKKKVYIIKQIY